MWQCSLPHRDAFTRHPMPMTSSAGIYSPGRSSVQFKPTIKATVGRHQSKVPVFWQTKSPRPQNSLD